MEQTSHHEDTEAQRTSRLAVCRRESPERDSSLRSAALRMTCHPDPTLREKDLALLFVGGKVQSEILRFAPLRSE